MHSVAPERSPRLRKGLGSCPEVVCSQLWEEMNVAVRSCRPVLLRFPSITVSGLLLVGFVDRKMNTIVSFALNLVSDPREFGLSKCHRKLQVSLSVTETRPSDSACIREAGLL